MSNERLLQLLSNAMLRIAPIIRGILWFSIVLWRQNSGKQMGLKLLNKTHIPGIDPHSSA